MSQASKIQLKTSSILNVPLQAYDDFTFIVNNKKFKTSRIISDLLSPIICKIHANDPTFDTFTINTQHQGNFLHVLNLLNFAQNDIQVQEIPFIIEIAEILENDSIDLTTQNQTAELTADNVLSQIKIHEISKIFTNKLEAEIDYVCSNLCTILLTHEDEFLTLEKSTIERILENPAIQIESEDQIISILNKLYLTDESYSNLYEHVLFEYVSEEKMKEFIQVFDYNDITNSIWKSLSNRLIEKIEKRKNKEGRHKKREIEFTCLKENEFNGILNYLKNLPDNDDKNPFKITSSTVNGTRFAENVINYENKTNYFSSGPTSNPWICFDFNKNKVLLKSYNIKKYRGPNQPKSWVIEGTNNENHHDSLSGWDVIDQHVDSDILKGNEGLSILFSVQNSEGKAYKYIRMRCTDNDWSGEKYLCLSAIEFFGVLI